MIGIDTNVLVRYLTQDDEQQALIATNIIKQHESSSQSLFISNIVICELVWVLERGYKYSKKDIVSVLQAILSTVEFNFEYYETLWLSTMEFEKSNADFSDILIGKIASLKGCMHTITFDIKATKLQEFKLAGG